MTTAQTHIECDIDGGCGSSDAMTAYEDGSKYCFSCGKSYFPNGSTQIKAIDIPDLIYVDLSRHGVKAATCRKYGIGIDPETNYLWQVHYLKGVPVAAKLKWYDGDGAKRFSFVGDKNVISMYGLHVAHHKYRLIITEGELDAAAAHQMTGWGAISLPFGCQSIDTYVRKALPLIDLAENIYVSMDMDGPGRQAHEQIMNLLPDGKTYEVFLPAGYKDASDMCVAGRYEEFKKCLFSAQPRIPSGIMKPNDVITQAMEYEYDPNKRVGISFGFPTLDAMFGGFRPSELSATIADTGVGKSTLCRQLMFNLAKQGHKSLYVVLEDIPPVSALHIAAIKLEHTLLSKSAYLHKERLYDALRWVTDHITFTNHVGAMDVEQLVKLITYTVRASDIKVVFLDHITTMVEGQLQATSQLANEAIARLRQVARHEGIHGHVISHIRKEEGRVTGKVRPTLMGIKHASSIPQACDFVFGLYPPSDNTLEVFDLKGGVRNYRSTTSKQSVLLDYNPQTTVLSEFTLEIDRHDKEKETRTETEGDHHAEWCAPGGPKSVRTKDTEEYPTSETGDVRSSPLQPSDGDTLYSRPNSCVEQPGSDEEKGYRVEGGIPPLPRPREGQATVFQGAVPRPRAVIGNKQLWKD